MNPRILLLFPFVASFAYSATDDLRLGQVNASNVEVTRQFTFTPTSGQYGVLGLNGNTRRPVSFILSPTYFSCDGATVSLASAFLATVNGKADQGDMEEALDAMQTQIDGIGAPTWSSITDKPSTFPPSSHTHPQSDITGLVSDLAGKETAGAAASAQDYAIQRANHTGTQAISTVSGLQPALDGKFAAPSGTTGEYLRGDGSTATFPSIPAAQVNSDWNASSGVSQILNKPTIPAAQVNADWGSSSGLSQILNKPSLFSGAFPDLASKPTTLSGYGITDPVALTNGSYSNPSWITSLSWVKITGAPTNVSSFTNDSGYLSGITSGQVTTALGYTPFNLPSQTGNSGKVLGTNGTVASWVSAATGTVTSVGLTSSTLTITGSPVTGSGSFTANLPNVVTAGTYGAVTVDAQGRVTAGKRMETYSGTTNGSGAYTVAFGTAYSVAPNIQANLINGADNQNIRITAISATGFTVLARTRTDVVGLLPSWANASGMAVDVLITEK